MKLYRITNWNTQFENNRTRELKKLDWFPLLNKQDGDGYTLIMDRKNGAAIFGAWVACLQIASRCDPRGTLLRDGGNAHDSTSLSRMSRISEPVISEMLSLLSSSDVNWLTAEDYANPALGCGADGGNPAPSVALGCLEGKGREGKGIEGKEVSCPVVVESDDCYHKDSRTVLHLLNEKSGSHFREVDGNLEVISARLNEPEITLEGVTQMLDRMVAKWKGTTMADYLRPTTLFGKQKFDGYYASRNLKNYDNEPVSGHAGSSPKPNPRNVGIVKGPTDYAATFRRIISTAETPLAGSVAATASETPAVGNP